MISRYARELAFTFSVCLSCHSCAYIYINDLCDGSMRRCPCRKPPQYYSVVTPDNTRRDADMKNARNAEPAASVKAVRKTADAWHQSAEVIIIIRTLLLLWKGGGARVRREGAGLGRTKSNHKYTQQWRSRGGAQRDDCRT